MIIDDTLQKYVWLIQTLQNAPNGLSLRELEQQWGIYMSHCGPFMGHDWFKEHRRLIRNFFGVDITLHNGVYIYANKDKHFGNMEQWMLKKLLIAVFNDDIMAIRDRIFIDNSCVGEEYIHLFARVIRYNKTIHLYYKKPNAKGIGDYTLDPWFLKLRLGRWYLIAYNHEREIAASFCLDRVISFHDTGQLFRIPKDDEEYQMHKSAAGMFYGKHFPPKEVIIQAFDYLPFYLETLPIHSSQEIVEKTEEYTTFKLYVAIAPDFENILCSYIGVLKVCGPSELRDSIFKRCIKGALDHVETVDPNDENARKLYNILHKTFGKNGNTQSDTI